MGLTLDQHTALASEGLVSEADFIDFKADELKTIFKNMRSSPPEVPVMAGTPEIRDADNNVIAAAIPGVAPIPGVCATPIPGKCVSRLLISSIAWNYYTDSGYIATANNMHFRDTLRDFYTEWEAIVTLVKQDLPKVPTLSKTNPPLRWCEFFKNVC